MFQWQSQAWRSIQLSAVPLKCCRDGVLVNPLLHPPQACLTHPGCEFFVAWTAYRCESVQSSEENKNWRLLNWYILNLSFFLVLFIKNSITASLYNSSCGIFHADVTQPGSRCISSPFPLSSFRLSMLFRVISPNHLKSPNRTALPGDEATTSGQQPYLTLGPTHSEQEYHMLQQKVIFFIPAQG